MRWWLGIGLAAMAAIDARPARACSHATSPGPFYMVLPRDGAGDVPTNAILAVAFADYRKGDPPNLGLRDRAGDVLPLAMTEDVSWGSGFPQIRSLRLTPQQSLSPATVYQFQVTYLDVTTVGTFTTGAGPDDAPVATPIVEQLTVGAAHSCQSVFRCCSSEPRVIDTEIALGETPANVAYVIREGTEILAADAHPPLIGLLVCGDYPPESNGQSDLTHPPEWLALGDRPHHLTLTARNLAGRESEPVALDLTGDCSNPDVGLGELPPSEAGCGCAAGGRGRSGGVLVLGAIAVALVLRRRIWLLVALAGCGCSDGALPCQVPSEPYRLAKLSACPTHLALDDTHVYWLDGARLMRFPKCGSSDPPQLLAETVARDLTVDEVAVYVPEQAGVKRIPKDGGLGGILAPMAAPPERVWAGNGWVFATRPVECVAGEPCGSLHPILLRMLRTGGDLEVVLSASGGQIFDLIGDGGPYLYVTGNLMEAAIGRVSPSGGTLESLITDGSGGGLPFAMDERFLYYAAGQNDIRRIPRDGGTPETLVTGQLSIDSLAVDGSHIFWVSEHVVHRAPASGGAVTDLVTGLDPSQVVADEGAIYFATCDFGDDAAVWIATK